jgi:hypothetical protein
MRRHADEGALRDPALPRPSRAAPIALFLVVAIAFTAAGAFSYGAGAADLRSQEEHALATAFTATAAEFLDRVPNPRLEKPCDRTVLLEAVARVAASPRAAAVV